VNTVTAVVPDSTVWVNDTIRSIAAAPVTAVVPVPAGAGVSAAAAGLVGVADASPVSAVDGVVADGVDVDGVEDWATTDPPLTLRPGDGPASMLWAAAAPAATRTTATTLTIRL
jgi:hypothetical protein